MGTMGTHRGGDALQLAQGDFVVHAADIPPHIIILGHCDLQGMGTDVPTPLPTFGVAQGQGTVPGQEGLLTHIPPGSLP